MEDTNKLQSINPEESNPLVREMKDELNIIANRVIDEWAQKMKNKLDKLWEMSLKYEEQQDANKRNYIRSGKTQKRSLLFLAHMSPINPTLISAWSNPNTPMNTDPARKFIISPYCVS